MNIYRVTLYPLDEVFLAPYIRMVAAASENEAVNLVEQDYKSSIDISGQLFGKAELYDELKTDLYVE